MPPHAIAFVRQAEAPILPPPAGSGGIVGWVRRNLLSSPLNIVLTLGALAFLAVTIPPLIRWAIVDAVWTGTSRADCLAADAGACWAYIGAKLPQFIYGRYPVEERWRVVVVFALLGGGLIPMAMPRVAFKRENATFLLVLFPVAALILLTGGNFSIAPRFVAAVVMLGCVAAALVAMVRTAGSGQVLGSMIAPAAAILAILFAGVEMLVDLPRVSLFGQRVLILDIASALASAVALLAALAAVITSPGRDGLRPILRIAAVVAGVLLLLAVLGFDFGLRPVETQRWGGLLVTLVVAITGIVFSLPLGVALALGRRSRLPVIRFASIAFIEFWRGVPLITVLFMASVMLPVFLPPGVNFDKLLRALIGVALFSSAYMAEVIRGGLQAIPRGQYEGAMAVGLSYWPQMRLIILPQALTLVIPGIVNSFIALFKDTSLVLIIGIMDLLGTIQSNNADSNWASPSTPATGYAFAAVVYWLFCFSMSRYSIFTERRLATGRRR